MIPTNVLLDKIRDLLAADTTTLAAAAGVKTHLAKNAFTPANNRVIGDFTEANFTGFAAKVSGTGTQQAFNDPTSGTRVVQILEPAGGWHWQATDGLQLPQVIYGWYVTDTTSAIVYGCQLLPTPITLTAALDSVDIGNVRLSFLPTNPT